MFSPCFLHVFPLFFPFEADARGATADVFASCGATFPAAQRGGSALEILEVDGEAVGYLL